MSSLRYDIDWLRKKGFFKTEKKIPIKYNKGEETYQKGVLLDEENALWYIEVKDNDELEALHKELKQYAVHGKTNYYWFYFPDGKIKVYRDTGGIRWFYFGPQIRRPERIKSKKDKLEKFSPQNMKVLFDVRDIIATFYNKLWEHRIRMAKTITNLRDDMNKLLVVQHFIDRLIFLYFISQLGLIKIKTKEYEITLTRDTTREFFKWICNELKTDDNLLEFFNKLFFDILGKVTSSGISSGKFKIAESEFEIVAPSLNGGLFIEKRYEGIRERDIKFGGIRSLILNLLNQYNWIIGEQLPEEEDVIGELTPEIIGHIYERFVVALEQMNIKLKELNLDELNVDVTRDKLMAGRKSIGAYYTPEEITYHISRNTIYPYLKDKLVRKFGEKAEEVFEKILNGGDSLAPNEIEILEHLLIALFDLKICDNACGSGSFLVAAGEILLDLYLKVIDHLEKNRKFIKNPKVRQILEESRVQNRCYYLVKHIITNNLYGIDIMEGAVEIAKLRFWLWLISQIDPRRLDLTKIEPLPNLDFNLMVGNTLIGFIDIADIEFSFLEKQTTLDAFLEKDKINWLKEIVKKKQEYKHAPPEKAKKIKQVLEQELNEAREFLNKKFYQKFLLNVHDADYDRFLELKPFHWGLEFPEVFDLDKPKEERGFDIIIGNPPYGNLLRPLEKKITNKLYTSKNNEIAGVFVERSIKCLKKHGYLGYIITFAITFNKDLSETRKVLWKNFEEIKIASFDRDKCRFFEGMSQSVSIIICKNKIENYDGAIFRTSRMFRSMPLSLENIIYSPANEFLLLDTRIILPNRFNVSHRLPKIGEEINLKILKKLVNLTKSRGIVKHIINIGNETMWIRTSGNYWYNAWDRKPYDSTEIRNIRVIDHWKNFLILLMNTSLLYWWFRIYGDGRHMNIDILEAFPLPSEEAIGETNEVLEKARKYLMEKLFSVFDPNRKRFNTSAVKDVLDVIDLLLSRYYYGLDMEEILWILNTDWEVRGGIRLDKTLFELIKYLHFLESIDNKEAKHIADFIENWILIPLLLELFIYDGLYRESSNSQPNFRIKDRISKYIKEIAYEQWSKLHEKKKKGNINSLQIDELRRLELKILAKIKDFIDDVKNDTTLIDCIQKIKALDMIQKFEKIVKRIY